MNVFGFPHTLHAEHNYQNKTMTFRLYAKSAQNQVLSVMKGLQTKINKSNALHENMLNSLSAR